MKAQAGLAAKDNASQGQGPAIIGLDQPPERGRGLAEHGDPFLIDEIEELKEEELILYCRSGARSGQAGLFLEAMGFKNVKNLVGGINDWKEKFGASN